MRVCVCEWHKIRDTKISVEGEKKYIYFAKNINRFELILVGRSIACRFNVINAYELQCNHTRCDFIRFRRIDVKTLYALFKWCVDAILS